MRDFEFRAWDDEMKLMLPPVDLSSPFMAWPEWFGSSDLLLMQYIGISDMSEQHQKLYEDDVVEITIFNPLLPEKIIVQKHRKIEFEAGVFGVRWNHILMPFCQFANTRIIKIGNIWENADLLEGDTQ